MAVNVPTYRNSRPQARPANRLRPPVYSVRGAPTRIPPAVAVPPHVRNPAARTAANKLASMLTARLAMRVAPFAFNPITERLAIEAYWYLQRKIAPPGFPGWDNIDPSYTENHAENLNEAEGTHDVVLEPGELAPNGFDVGSYNTGTLRDGLVDLNDGSAISGFRYWGEFHALPQAPHTISPRPDGDDWPVEPYAIPRAPEVRPGRAPAYRPLPDLAPRPRPRRWNARRAIVFEVPLAPVGGPAPVVRARLNQRRTRPPRRVREIKGRMTGVAYDILAALVSGHGEVQDVIDVVADASHYHPDSVLIPREFPRDSPQAKLWWLFVAGGVNHFEMDELLIGLAGNQIEDTVFGIAGAAAGKGSAGLHLTFGVQSGPVL